MNSEAGILPGDRVPRALERRVGTDQFGNHGGKIERAVAIDTGTCESKEGVRRRV
jgi:hypothetical protein